MDLLSLQSLNWWAVRFLLCAGAITVIATYAMHWSDSELQKLYECKASTERREIVQKIEVNTPILKDIHELILSPDSPLQRDAQKLRKKASNKYLNGDYFEALRIADKAIELDKNSAKSYLLRAYIFGTLYEEFMPLDSGSDQNVKIK